MEAYAEYKDSGVDWLGQVPADWKEKPIFAIADLRSTSGLQNRELLSVYLNQGVIRFSDVTEKRTNVTSLDLSNYQGVEKGDLVLNNQQAWRGSVGVSPYTGIVSPAYIILKLCADLNTKFSNYFFRDGAMVAHYLTSSKGVGTIQRNLYWPKLKRAPVFLPPLPEQTAIAGFLDDKVGKVEELVAIKQAQIALLKERKQILIQEVVTKGLNPDAPMKDSGIDWIGQIPAHWEVKPLKRLLARPLKYGANEEAKESIVGDPRYIRITDFDTDGSLRSDTVRTLPHKVAKDYMLESGDILLARSGGTVGKAFLFRENIEACFAGYLIQAKPNEVHVSSVFLDYYLRSPAFEAWKDKTFSRATIQNISAEKYAVLPVPCPPLSEQKSIVVDLAASAGRLDEAIEVKQRQIEALKEYKVTLINAAVTGKIKVPEQYFSKDV